MAIKASLKAVSTQSQDLCSHPAASSPSPKHNYSILLNTADPLRAPSFPLTLPQKKKKKNSEDKEGQWSVDGR